MPANICLLIDKPRFSAAAEGTLLTGYDLSIVEGACKRAGLMASSYEVRALSNSTLEQINSANYDVILPLDSGPLEFITGKKSIWKWHLSPLDALPEFRCRRVVPTFHPDQLKKEWYLNVYFEMAVKRAAQHARSGPWERKAERYLLDPSHDQTISVLEQCVRHTDWLSIDIETGRNQVNTFGVAWSPSDAIAVKVLPGGMPPAAHYKIWDLIRQLCENDAPKVMQNGIYERLYLSRYGIQIRNFAHDTMCAQKFLYPELEKGLDNVGRIYTMEPYWKDDGRVESEEGKQKDWGNIRDWDRHLDYNCLAKGTKVVTENGLIAINEIARKKLKLNVRSFNEKAQKFEWKPVTNWLVKKEPTNINWTKLTVAGAGKGSSDLLLTPDHKVLTSQGWTRADQVLAGSFVCDEKLRHDAGTMLGTILGDSSTHHTSDKNVAYLACSQINLELINLKQCLFGGTVTSTYRTSNLGGNTFHTLYVPPCAQIANLKRAKLADILDHLTPMGIALWFMDDGCKQRGSHMKLAVQSYSQSERQAIKHFLTAHFGKCSLYSSGNIALSRAASLVLCRKLGKYFVPSMRYKLSHPGAAPIYSFGACLEFCSRISPISRRVIKVGNETKKARGYSTSYCISVSGNENFLTEHGVVANCKDTSNTLIASRNQRQDLNARGLDALYDGYIRRLFDCTYEMCARGLPLNVASQKRLIAEYEAKSAELTKSLSAEINPRSFKQKIKLLQDQGLKIPKKKDKKTGNYKDSSDELTLKKMRLQYPDNTDIRALLQIAGIEKALSSYLRVRTFDDDRIRFMLDTAGTETLRMSCSNDPWNNGFNAQTMTDYVKEMIEFKPEEDRVFIEIDLEQAELRYVALEAADETLIGMIERKEDIHKFVAAGIYQKPMADITHDERQLGKKSVHGGNYDEGVVTFMESCLKEMDLVLTRAFAAKVLAGYHERFPGIRRRQATIRNTIYNERKLVTPWGSVRYFYGRMDHATYREAYAHSPQTSIPYVVNKLMLHMQDKRTEGAFDFHWHGQVHDSLILSCRTNQVEKIVRYSQATELWHPELILPAGRLVIPTSAKSSSCLGTMKKINL